MQPMRFRFDSMLPQRAGVWRRGVDRPIDHWEVDGPSRGKTEPAHTCLVGNNVGAANPAPVVVPWSMIDQSELLEPRGGSSVVG